MTYAIRSFYFAFLAVALDLVIGAAITSAKCPAAYTALAALVSGYPPAQSFCSSKYPLSKATVTTTAAPTTITATVATSTISDAVTITVTLNNARKRAITTTTTPTKKSSTTKTSTTKSVDAKASAWSSIAALATSIVGKICTCIESSQTVTVTTTPTITASVTATVTTTSTATATATADSYACSDPRVCGNFVPNCGVDNSCYCAGNAAGGGTCFTGDVDGSQPCTTDADCASDQVCFVDSCIGSVCVAQSYRCNNPGSAARMFRRDDKQTVWSPLFGLYVEV